MISFCLTFFVASLQPYFGSGPVRVASLTAPFYVNNAEFKSVLFVRNDTASSVDMRVTFESLEAEKIGQKAVELDPYAGISIDVDSVEMAPHRFAALGSITLMPEGTTSFGITAHVTITSRNPGNAISLEEKLQHENQNTVQVGSLPSSFSVPVLAIHSTSRLPERILVDCTGAHGESFESQMTLPPGMTFLVNGCIGHRSEGHTYEDILRGNGGRTKGPMEIQVKSDQGSGGVVVWGFASTSETARSSFQTIGIEFDRGNNPTREK